MKEPNGLRCTACASHRTKVLWRRWRVSDGAITRRHECQDCRERFSSREASVSRLVAKIQPTSPRIV